LDAIASTVIYESKSRSIHRIFKGEADFGGPNRHVTRAKHDSDVVATPL